MKLSVQEGLLPGKTLEEKFTFAERLGFDGVELRGRGIEDRLKEIKDALSVVKIKVSTICSGYRGDLLGSSKEERELAMKDIILRLKIASELGAVGVIVVPTFGKPKLPDLSPLFSSIEELEKKLLIAELKELGKYANDYEAYILLEPLNRYETHFLRTVDQAIEICNEVNMTYVKMMADFFHMNIEEVSIPESLRKAANYLRHIHLADSNRWLPGYGHTDFKTAFQVLKEIGYKYYMALECYAPEPREQSLKKCINFLKGLM